MKKFIKVFLIILFLASLGFGFKYTFAAPPLPVPVPTSTGGGSGGQIPLPDPGNLPSVDITSLVGTVIQVIFAVGQIAFVIVLLVGGVTFITSAGNEQQAEKAKKLIFNAIIGIVVLFSAWGIASFIVDKLK